MKIDATHPDTRLFWLSWRGMNSVSNGAVGSWPAPKNSKTTYSRMFLANRKGDGNFTFATVGNDVNKWAGRDLKDHEVSSIFVGADKYLIRALIESAIYENGAAIARISAFGAGFGQRVEFELLILPMAKHQGRERIICLLQPLENEERLPSKILRFAINSLIPPDPQAPSISNLNLAEIA